MFFILYLLSSDNNKKIIISWRVYMNEKVDIGIIGGSGVYELDNIKMIKELTIDTPFGKPSDNYIICDYNGIKIVFLSRHGMGHKILPTELNVRANIWGFKKLGVKKLIGISAVGSLQEEIEPSHIVFPNQIIDRTKGRASTFFGDGIVAHVAFANPFCSKLTSILIESAKDLGVKYHTDKTYICMEGPAFSTRAESDFHRSIGGDIIGMTAIPEAKLAREAEMCYSIIALSTDYDCWRDDEEAVTAANVVDIIKKNVKSAKKILEFAIPRITYNECDCNNALQNALMTSKEYWPDNTIKNLLPIISKYI